MGFRVRYTFKDGGIFFDSLRPFFLDSPNSLGQWVRIIRPVFLGSGESPWKEIRFREGRKELVFPVDGLGKWLSRGTFGFALVLVQPLVGPLSSVLVHGQEPGAQGSPTALPVIQLSTEQNMEKLLHIRLAFQKHPTLGSLNLGIQYQNGLVTLWGPVPQQDLIPQAKRFALTLKGVTEVRSEMYTGRTGERQTGPVAALVPSELPVRVQAASPNPHTGKLPAHTPREENSQPRRLEPVFDSLNAPPSGLSTGTQAPTPLPTPSIAGVGQVLRLPKSEPSAAATTGLGSPPEVGMGPLGGSIPVPIELKPAPPPVPRFSVSETLVEVRSSSERFRNLTWILKGNHLEIYYQGFDNTVAVEFARAAQRVAGVEAVRVLQRF